MTKSYRMSKVYEAPKKLLLLLFSLSLFSISLSQKPLKASINISSEFYKGKDLMVLGGSFWLPIPHTDFKYADTSNVSYSVKKDINIKKSGNNVEILLAYPHPFGIAYFDTASQSGNGSNIFFIGNGKVNISVEDFSKGRGNVTSKMSQLNIEYLELRKSYNQYVNFETGEVNNLFGKLKVLDKYVTKNPNSYVAMWDFALSYNSSLTQKNKVAMLASLYKFSDKLKQTKTFISYIELLEQDLLFKKGVVIPNILIKTGDSLLAIAAKNRYTLVDFWFSSCIPCVAQFPDLLKTYNAFKAKGFEIIGISTDSDETQWKQAIDKYQLNWIQQLDENESISKQYFIRKFPTNFLIDSHGKILAVDIKPVELSIFLYANMGTNSPLN